MLLIVVTMRKHPVSVQSNALRHKLLSGEAIPLRLPLGGVFIGDEGAELDCDDAVDNNPSSSSCCVS